uniref:Uncharacterized protein n=1 Tax=Ditylum brightwellii TaxID=49249 RepID=A0A7S4S639_9STRA|mmetsp:Transcript_30497/g.40713  ORF Transcript_30497/g.40713 Transcript_30497/m.40713 type:complete len:178 (-) Transcript_30497:20-553(-)
MPFDTALHKASHNGDFKQVTALIEAGEIDVNTPGASERRPLHRAAGGNHVKICEYLLSNGAGVDLADRSGRTPLHWASIGGGTSSASLLIENGANVLAETGSKATPLHFSVEKGNIDMVPLLANNAGNKKLELFRAQRDDGKTALNIAKEGKNKGIIKALKEAGDPSATSSAICIIS